LVETDLACSRSVYGFSLYSRSKRWVNPKEEQAAHKLILFQALMAGG